MHPHLARDVRQNHMVVIKANLEHGVWQGLYNLAFKLYGFFFFRFSLRPRTVPDQTGILPQ
ncbi:MAG: hypothetical protein ACYCXL_05735 [Thermoleophilia bacterium]